MKLKGNFIILFLMLCLSAVTQDITKLRIDPARAYGGTVSEYFESIEYIPLETNKESLFGDIKKMLITDSSFVILDYDTKAILFFELNGKYITKKKFNLSDNPGIFYDKQSARIEIAFYNSTRRSLDASYYSLKGRSLDYKNKSFKSVEEFINNHLLPLGDGYFLKTNPCFNKGKDTIINLVEIYNENGLHNSFIPYNTKSNIAACKLVGGLKEIVNVSSEGEIYLATPIAHLIYKVNKNIAEQVFQVVFPVNRSIPEKIIHSTDEKVIDSFAVHFMSDRNIITGVGNIFFHKNLMFFKTYTNNFVTNGSSESFGQYNFIYDTLSHRLVSLERMNADKGTYYLPFFQSRGPEFGLEYCNGNFYTPISSLRMFTVREATKDKRPQYPPVLQQYFKTQSRKSNPVIVKMKLKDF